MSYVVLARKYRPRTFSQMVGQDVVVRALTNALANQRLHHAYLFTGTRGIGKTTVSRILAKSLNCTGPDGSGGITAEPCGVCQACTEIDADRYLDYTELDAASNRGIDEARDLIERAAYKPVLGRFKVFMIDEAHQLTKDAFSALLKTLEEPPEYLKFVLATTDPEKMLPTVLSRCLQFNLRPMAPEVVYEHLVTVLKAENVGYDEPSLRLLSRAARGSMRDGLSLADQAIAFGGGTLEQTQVRAMLGAVDTSYAESFVEALARHDGPAVLAGVNALRERGLSAGGALGEMAALLQRMAVEQAVPGALDATDPDTPTSVRLAALLAPDSTQLLYSIVLHGRGELHLAPDEYAGLSMVLLRMFAFPKGGAGLRSAAHVASAAPAAAAPASNIQPGPGPARALNSAASAGAAAPSRQAPAAAARPSPAASEPPAWLDEVPPPDGELAAPPVAATPQRNGPARGVVELEVRDSAPQLLTPEMQTALGDRWAEAVARLNHKQAINALVRELAMRAELVAADAAAEPGGPECWRLRVERESLRTAPLREKLQAALDEHLDAPAPRIELVAGVAVDSPARRETADKERRQREAEQAIHDDPLVREVLAQFKTARIVPGSIKPH